ncbi:hypothetical protein [Photobacterium leiognathi]|uniref:hypothetical protein n=1 Tax=Photobacterium leiognathi TaxID=553611 RepID=UPI0027384557|nr:hypothetical protein [Photobacterium leiognathi]
MPGVSPWDMSFLLIPVGTLELTGVKPTLSRVSLFSSGTVRTDEEDGMFSGGGFMTSPIVSVK